MARAARASCPPARCARCSQGCRGSTSAQLIVGHEGARRRRRVAHLGRARRGADDRLLHADRRRPVHVRADRGDERVLRHLRDGRAARVRAERRRVPEDAADGAARRDPARRRRRRRGGRRGRRRRALDRRPRAEVRHGGDGVRAPRRGVDERGRPGGRRARALEADRHGDRDDGGQARRAGSRGGRRGGRVDDDAERRGGRRGARERGRTPSPTSPGSASSGHARELAAGAGLRAEIDWAAVRLLPACAS